MDQVSLGCYFLCSLFPTGTVNAVLITATVMETPIRGFLKWFQTGELHKYKKKKKKLNSAPGNECIHLSSATPHQQRCLLFIVGVKTITQINIEYACISEGIEENKCSKMSF